MLLISLLLPAVSDASYIIHLKNGGRFLTSHYWEEDNYVTFYIAGGTMGIEKNSVRKIERSTLDLDGIYEVKKPDKGPAQVEPKASMPGIPEKEEKEKDSAKKDPSVVQEFNNLEKIFQSRDNLSTDELREFKYNLAELRGKIVSSPLATDFREEANKITEMRRVINDLLNRKSSGQ